VPSVSRGLFTDPDAIAILAALPCGALLCDPGATIVSVNRPAAELLGRDADELCGRRIDDPTVWPPGLLAADGRPIDAPDVAVERVPGMGGLVREQVLGLKPADGRATTWVTFSGREVRSAAGRLEAVVCLLLERGEIHRSTRELWARAGRLRHLLDCVPDTYFVLDAADRIDEWYGGEAPFLVHRHGSLIGTPLVDLLPPDCVQTAVQAFAEVRTGLPASSFDLAWESADGPRFGEAFCRLLPDGMLAVIVRDVTERWEAEEELLTIEEQYRLLAENAHDVITRLRCRPVPRAEYVSPSVERLLGYVPEAFYRDDTLLFRSLHPDHVSTARAILAGRWDFERPWEVCYRHRDGHEVWVEQQMTPGYDARGVLVTIDTVSRDVTERHRQAELLRESEARFRLLAAPDHDVIWQLRLHPELRYEYVSPSVSRLLGCTPEEIMADPHLLDGLLYPESLLQAERACRGELAPDELQVLHWRTRDGGEVFTEGRVTTVRDQDGRPLIVQGVARDVTRRVQAERALRDIRQERQLELTVREILLTAADDQVYAQLIDAVCGATGSRHGIVLYVREGVIACPSPAVGRWWDGGEDSGRRADRSSQEPWGREIFELALSGSRSTIVERPAGLAAGPIPLERVLITPIVYRGAAIGLVVVGDRPGPYDTEAVELLEGVAAQMGPLLNARLGFPP
jgi:PAS domain S-box-containing protein